MRQKVFISYAAQDRSFAESLKPKLNQFLAQPSQPLDFFDVQSSVAPGEDFRKAIKAAMDTADTVVIVSSPYGDSSQWVNYEAGLADALGKKVVIVGRKGMRQSALVQRFQENARFIEVDDVVTPGLSGEEAVSIDLLRALGLTRAEAEVAHLIHEGISPKEIAKRRGRTIHAVRRQLQSTYKKLKVRSQPELVRKISDWAAKVHETGHPRKRVEQ